MSMVKIVDVELIMDANEDTIAAASAARIRPLSPTGIKFLINYCPALSLAILPAVPKKPSLLKRPMLNVPVSVSRFIT